MVEVDRFEMSVVHLILFGKVHKRVSLEKEEKVALAIYRQPSDLKI